MRRRGILLISIGILGAIFVSAFDLIVGKPINDITGPKSISAFIVCGLFIIKGFIDLKRTPRNKS